MGRVSRPRGYVCVLSLWILTAALRIIFGIISTMEGTLLDVEVPLVVVQTINIMFLVLGVTGIIAAIGLVKIRVWGYQATVLVSCITIIFDIWGVMIQVTAVMGFIMPVIALVYFIPNRSFFRQAGRDQLP